MAMNCFRNSCKYQVMLGYRLTQHNKVRPDTNQVILPTENQLWLLKQIFNLVSGVFHEFKAKSRT